MSFELLSICNIFGQYHCGNRDKCLNARKPNPETKMRVREGEGGKRKTTTEAAKVFLFFDEKFHHRTHTNAF